MRILLLGPPGAGKGTQAQHICRLFNIPHISTGDIFMKNISQGTELGRKAKDFMDKGQLVPDELTIKLVEDRLEEEDTKTGYLLDGFPRTENQARVLGELLESKGEALDVALHIDVPETVIKSRMLGRRVCPSCGATYHIEFNPPKTEGICDKCDTNLIQRKDDLPEAVEARLKVYTISTRPLIEFYRRKGILKVVEGDREIEEVSESITRSLQSRLQTR
jgi:adenylate kinase